MEVGNVDHGVVIYGCGLDELSPLGPSTVYEIKNTAAKGKPKKYKTNKFTLEPRRFGIKRCKVEELKGGDPEQNVQELKAKKMKQKQDDENYFNDNPNANTEIKAIKGYNHEKLVKQGQASSLGYALSPNSVRNHPNQTNGDTNIVNGDEGKNKSPATKARQRLLSDVYGSNALGLGVSSGGNNSNNISYPTNNSLNKNNQESADLITNEDWSSWKPSMGHGPSEQKKRMALEQKQLLEEQMEESKRRKEQEKRKLEKEELEEERRVRAELAVINGEPIPQESIPSVPVVSNVPGGGGRINQSFMTSDEIKKLQDQSNYAHEMELLQQREYEKVLKRRNGVKAPANVSGGGSNPYISPKNSKSPHRSGQRSGGRSGGSGSKSIENVIPQTTPIMPPSIMNPATLQSTNSMAGQILPSYGLPMGSMDYNVPNNSLQGLSIDQMQMMQQQVQMLESQQMQQMQLQQQMMLRQMESNMGGMIPSNSMGGSDPMANVQSTPMTSQHNNPHYYANTAGTGYSTQVPQVPRLSLEQERFMQMRSGSINPMNAMSGLNPMNQLRGSLDSTSSVGSYGSRNGGSKIIRDTAGVEASFVSESRLVPVDPYGANGMLSQLLPETQQQNKNSPSKQRLVGNEVSSILSAGREDSMVEQSLTSDSLLLFLGNRTPHQTPRNDEDEDSTTDTNNNSPKKPEIARGTIRQKKSWFGGDRNDKSDKKEEIKQEIKQSPYKHSTRVQESQNDTISSNTPNEIANSSTPASATKKPISQLLPPEGSVTVIIPPRAIQGSVVNVPNPETGAFVKIQVPLDATPGQMVNVVPINSEEENVDELVVVPTEGTDVGGGEVYSELDSIMDVTYTTNITTSSFPSYDGDSTASVGGEFAVHTPTRKQQDAMRSSLMKEYQLGEMLE